MLRHFRSGVPEPKIPQHPSPESGIIKRRKASKDWIDFFLFLEKPFRHFSSRQGGMTNAETFSSSFPKLAEISEDKW